MILGFRAMQLAREMSKPILVLCYNRTLAARLEQLIGERGLGEKVQVYNFHKWCRKMLVAYHVDLPPQGRSEEHTSELQSLMRISYAVFCLKKKKKTQNTQHKTNT